MERNFSFILDHLRWKTTQLLLISNMYFSKHAEYVNPVKLELVLLLLMTAIHIIGIFSMKNILQEKNGFFIFEFYCFSFFCQGILCVPFTLIMYKSPVTLENTVFTVSQTFGNFATGRSLRNSFSGCTRNLWKEQKMKKAVLRFMLAP